MQPETLPPFRHISSQFISQTDASSILSKYITNSESHPHLHPDALITPAGVTFSSHGGPSGGVVMHNLRRVAAGLRGEYLEPEATPEPETQENQSAGVSNGKWKKSEKSTVDTPYGMDDWQTMSEFEREEGNHEVGESGARLNAVQEGGDALEVETIGEVDAEDGGKKRKPDESKLDKEAKRTAKKARNKEFKQKKEQARAK